MYEPKRPPRLYSKTPPLPAMRYGIYFKDTFIDVDDPTIDPLHIHESLEIFYNVRDEVSFLVNGTVYPVKAGQVLISRPGDVHVCIFPESKSYLYGCLWIDTELSSPLFSFLTENDFSPLITPEENSPILDLLEEIDRIKDDESLGTRALTLILSILSELSRGHRESRRTAPLPESLTAIIRYIDTHCTEIRSVGEIVEKFFISPSTLNRHFRTYLHTAPREYIEAKRLSHALALLKNGASVTKAAEEAGFPDCSHFIMLFKKKFGKTPLRYKKDLL